MAPVSDSTAVTWGQFEEQAPDLAERIQLRFESHMHVEKMDRKAS